MVRLRHLCSNHLSEETLAGPVDCNRGSVSRRRNASRASSWRHIILLHPLRPPIELHLGNTPPAPRNELPSAAGASLWLEAKAAPLRASKWLGRLGRSDSRTPWGGAAPLATLPTTPLCHPLVLLHLPAFTVPVLAVPHRTAPQTVSVDVKIAPIPISITSSALTEVAWILGGFVGKDDQEPPKRARDRRGADSSIRLRVPRVMASPLMPVKVIYRKPSKVSTPGCPYASRTAPDWKGSPRGGVLLSTGLAPPTGQLLQGARGGDPSRVVGALCLLCSLFRIKLYHSRRLGSLDACGAQGARVCAGS